MKRDKKNDLILIVDDHPLLQIGVKGLVELVRPDAEFHFAGTKKDVLAKLSNKTFDLIVSDLNLPDSDMFWHRSSRLRNERVVDS